MRISSAFDGGNIEVVELARPDDVQLRILPDRNSAFLQWFYFRLQGARGQHCRLRLLNACDAAYPDGWVDYKAVASYDRRNWFRVPTHFDGESLVIEHQPATDSVYFAYFAPYSWERHLDLLARAEGSPRVRVVSVGESLDGRPLDLLQIGSADPEKRRVWITARQHPGETMAEWFMEGLIERLLDESDPVTRKLLGQAVFYLVPNMNPDGSVRGHLRTNAAGVNLNREWHAPSAERSPEVLAVRNQMDATGVDLYLDIHGDEGLPYNFVVGCENNPGYSARIAGLEGAFKDAFLDASPDFQVTHGYPQGQFEEETLTLASNQVGQRFDCLALTLEMPFKDNADLPGSLQGWSPERSRRLGAAVLQPILAVQAKLR
nr:M14-type cytosolic carboxypeptidase [Motiliproteus sp. SC1-56]